MKKPSSLGLLLFVALHATLAALASADSPLCTPGDESPDVLIIGAGMAGLTAAKRLQDLGITYKLFESTDRVGGRVRSAQFGGYTVEDGANWVSEGNKASALATEYGLKLTRSHFENFAIYEYNPSGGNPTQIRRDYNRVREKFNKAFRCVLRKAEAAFLPGGPDLSLDVLQVVLPECGWRPKSVKESLAFFFPWFNLEYEFGTTTVPLAGMVGEEPVNYFVNDERGFDFLPRNFKDVNSIPVEFGKRVSSIKYDVPDDVYPALVTTIDPTTSNCIEYKAKHVLSTVPIGVYESGDIAFDPPLLYPQAPFKQQQYAKIFYQFKTKFWDDMEFIVALKQSGNEGICHHWQNLDYVKRSQLNSGGLATSREFYPDSKILFCTMNSDAMNALLGGEDNVKTTNLSEQQIRGVLLDPLRAVYGNEIVDANLEAFYDPQLNTDSNTGFGAYSSFKGDKGPSGDVLKNMYNFFGGDIPGVDIERCDHNGCAEINGVEKWVLHMGGTASCFESYEFVYGAIDSGRRSANYIANELGYNVRTKSRCEDFNVEDGETRHLRHSGPRWAHV